MHFITFTRKTGTNGSEVAGRVARELGYELYGTEAIEDAAREMGFLREVRGVDEKAPSLVDRLFSRRPEICLDRLNSVIYELASRGSAVFLGRGSHILLRDFPCALHVRVVASFENRVAELIRRVFQLRPKGIIEALDLRRPIYRKTVNYGHFGRPEKDFLWERTDKVDQLRAQAGLGSAR